jgi:hypothetical protein
VGHHLWFAGLTALLVTVVGALRARPVRSGPVAVGLAVLVGLTWAANIVEAGAVPFGAAIALGLSAYGWRLRATGTGRLLVVTFVVSLVLTAAYGIWRGGYPQFSELGWL